MAKVKYPARAITWRMTPASSNVRAVGWVAGEDGLYVEFKNGSRYLYYGVPANRVRAMLRSESVGGYLNRSIKPNYDCVRVDGSLAAA